MKNLYLPKDTFEAKAKANSIDNFALRLNKYPKIYSDKFVIYHKYRENKSDKEIKVNIDFENSQKQILKFSAKYFFSLQQMADINLEISSFQPDWRLVVGLGASSVYETSITLHHIYGFPYIPGQAVKGVTRNYVICEYFDKDEKHAEEDEIFKKIFGTQTQAGEIIFFDAYPQTEPKMDFDIMNIHYPDYYSGKSEPTDNQKINPITFLTVIDTTFFFPIGIPKNYQKENFTIKGKSISDLIQFALENKGIGAKSSVGYGYLAKSDKRDRLFEKEYKKFVAQEEAELEKAKPLHIKLAETLSTNSSEALGFLQSDEQSVADKAALSQAFIDFYSDSQAWNVKKINGQQFDFANQAHAFLQIYGTKVPDIVHYIKKYGGKNLKKKYK